MAALFAHFGKSNLAQIKEANASLSSQFTTLNAVFIGATAGIGLGTLRAFAKHVPRPRAIILGRSKAAFAPVLEELKRSNPNGEFEFIETDVSLLKNVDAASKTITERMPEINILCMSQGFINFGPRQENSDGLDVCTSLRYYTRLRFAVNLLPHMRSPIARVVSVLAAGYEGPLVEDDLELKKNYSIGNAAGHGSTMTALAFEKLAQENPDVGFVHVYPGLVRTNLMVNSTSGLLGIFMRWVVTPTLGLFCMTPEDCGERIFAYATTAEFSGAGAEGEKAGVRKVGGGIAKGQESVVKGAWFLDWDGKVIGNEEVLAGYRKKGMGEVVWKHTEEEWQRVLS